MAFGAGLGVNNERGVDVEPTDNVEALVIPIDPEAVKRGLQAQEALARQAEELAKNKQKAK